jgi:plastocyanin
MATPARIGPAALAGALAALILALALVPSEASAANRRIAIGDFMWSDDELRIDKGEHVTWYWIGPDTLHSVTGQGPPASGLDSDPGTNFPDHDIGDTFKLDFDTPGTYKFQCKLHSSVRGTVTVSDKPGDPVAEPDPVPKSRVDRKAPNLRNVRIDRTAFRRNGTSMKYSINEPARVDLEYFQLRRGGKRKRFAGYARHKRGYVGLNRLRFGIRRSHFKARPGRYIAKVTATDESANTTRPTKLRFRILKSGKRKR